jgi:hypothetical protein
MVVIVVMIMAVGTTEGMTMIEIITAGMTVATMGMSAITIATMTTEATDSR